MKKPFLLPFSAEFDAKTVPFWFMRQAGRYLPEYLAIRQQCGSFLDLCYNPEKAAEVTLQPLKRFDMDAAILFADILLIPDALGQKVTFVKGEGPKLDALNSAKSVDALHFNPQVLAPIYETIKIIKQQLSPEKALIGFSGSPWTLACYMIQGSGSKDFALAQRFALQQPAAFDRLISILEASIIHYLDAQIKAGADAVQLFDSWAGMCNAHNFDRYVIAPTQRIVAALKKSHPQVPVIGFPRLSGIGYARFASQTGVDGVSLDTQITPDWAKQQLATSDSSKKIVLQGNLDSLLLACDATKALDQAKYLVEAYQGVPYIFNLGHGFVPDTPIAHVEKLVEYLKSLR